MPTKGGRRQQEKRLKYQIKQAFNSGQDPFPLFQKLALLLNNNQPRISERPYTLIPIEISLTLPRYKDIPKRDPRRLGYKFRHLFG